MSKRDKLWNNYQPWVKGTCAQVPAPVEIQITDICFFFLKKKTTAVLNEGEWFCAQPVHGKKKIKLILPVSARNLIYQTVSYFLGNITQFKDLHGTQELCGSFWEVTLKPCAGRDNPSSCALTVVRELQVSTGQLLVGEPKPSGHRQTQLPKPSCKQSIIAWCCPCITKFLHINMNPTHD